MLRTRTMLALAMIGVSLPLAATPAVRAGLIPNKVAVAQEGDFYRWDYQVVVTSDLYVSKGDFFTIYDFSGNIAGKETYDTNLWDLTVSNKTPVAAKYGSVNPNDDPNIPDYTFRYKGNSTVVGSALLGDFTFLTPYNVKTDSVFTSVNHRIDNTTVGPDPQEFNLTPTVVAVAGTPEPPPPAETPEPATLALFGAALPLLLARKFRRAK
ncbi:MAG: PEP-CTERM sorting domain-containing protein [Gemmataceae bacterium]